jgi:hypothetical protein
VRKKRNATFKKARKREAKINIKGPKDRKTPIRSPIPGISFNRKKTPRTSQAKR